MKLSSFLLILATFLSGIVAGQNEISIDDYNRAVRFLSENSRNKTLFNLYIQPNWFSDSTGVWYINQTPENKKYLKVSFPDQIKSDLFDHQKLATILTDSLATEIKANDLPITRIEYKSPTKFLITSEGKSLISDLTRSIWHIFHVTSSRPSNFFLYQLTKPIKNILSGSDAH